MRLSEVTDTWWQFIPDRVEPLPQGVNLWYKGVPYPKKVYYSRMRDANFFVRTLEALGVVKKFLYALTFLKGVVIPYRLSIKKYELFLTNLYQQFYWILAEFFIKDEEYSVCVWEMGKFFKVFLTELGLSGELSENYTGLARMFLEFDNAYRYRPQDWAGIVNLELLKANPRKEIKRVFLIYLEREVIHKDEPTWGAKGKITRLVNIFSYALLIPKVKRAFLKAVEAIDLEKIKFDENDRFYFSWWYGYDFEGKTFEERFAPYEELFKTIPFQKKEDPQKTLNFMVGE